MRKFFPILLVLLLAAAPASAQHHHGGAMQPESFTATPAFGPDGTL